MLPLTVHAAITSFFSLMLASLRKLARVRSSKNGNFCLAALFLVPLLAVAAVALEVSFGAYCFLCRKIRLRQYLE